MMLCAMDGTTWFMIQEWIKLLHLSQTLKLGSNSSSGGYKSQSIIELEFVLRDQSLLHQLCPGMLIITIERRAHQCYIQIFCRTNIIRARWIRVLEGLVKLELELEVQVVKG